jgi:hypothetical protein
MPIMGYETTDGTTVSALYYNFLFYGATTRMSPVVYKSMSACKGSVSAMGSSYCMTGAAGATTRACVFVFVCRECANHQLHSRQLLFRQLFSRQLNSHGATLMGHIFDDMSNRFQ